MNIEIIAKALTPKGERITWAEVIATDGVTTAVMVAESNLRIAHGTLAHFTDAKVRILDAEHGEILIEGKAA